MRQIIHIDLDAFYASVEMHLNPALQGKPLIVAMGDPRSRGVVATASYQARPFGVHSAMPLKQALRLCPQAVVVPVRHQVYREHSRRVISLLREYSPLVEQVSIDEAYLEIPADRDAPQIARAIQQRIDSEFGLSCTLAVAGSKLLSKIACNTVKPRGFIVVETGGEQQFLAPLPVGMLPGVGHVTRARLARWKVERIGDLAQVDERELRAEFGKLGGYFHAAALGRDDSPVVVDAKTKSVSQENTFDRDTRDARQVKQYLKEMSEGVASELQRESYRARTVVLKLRYSDFTTATRQTTLSAPTADAAEIGECAFHLLDAHWDKRRPLRLVGVGAHNLIEPDGTRQLEFPLSA